MTALGAGIAIAALAAAGTALYIWSEAHTAAGWCIFGAIITALLFFDGAA